MSWNNKEEITKYKKTEKMRKCSF